MVEDTDFRSALDETGAREMRYETDPAPGPVAAPATVTEERTVEHVAEPLPARAPFSVAAGFFGWAVAMWFALLFTGIALAFLGNAAYANSTITSDSIAISQAALNDLTTTGIVAGLVSLFLAYFLGGYAAGRIGRSDGAWHGVAVVGWTVLFGVVGALLANYAASYVNLSAYFTTYRVDWNAVTTNTIVALVISLLVMLAGAVLGGVLGDNIAPRYAYDAERRRVSTWRGRPRV